MALDAALDVCSKTPSPSPPTVDSSARGGRRSKRRAGSPASDGGGGVDGNDQPEQEEYLAQCLLMLSHGLPGDGAAPPSAAAKAKAKAIQQHHQHGRYECSVCGKVYTSYQALGGHKTSHRKPPVVAPAPAPAPGGEAEASLSGGTAHAATEKTHRCSVCKRTFQSGQALGGHKRLHYEAKAKDADAVAATAVLQNLDLNLPAEGAPPEPKRARTMLLLA